MSFTCQGPLPGPLSADYYYHSGTNINQTTEDQVGPPGPPVGPSVWRERHGTAVRRAQPRAPCHQPTARLLVFPFSTDCPLHDAIHPLQASLTQQVALIQGPPGTGKTYEGIQLMRVLLSNLQPSELPVLCVCYTNHALDQVRMAPLPHLERPDSHRGGKMALPYRARFAAPFVYHCHAPLPPSDAVPGRSEGSRSGEGSGGDDPHWQQVSCGNEGRGGGSFCEEIDLCPAKRNEIVVLRSDVTVWWYCLAICIAGPGHHCPAGQSNLQHERL